MEKSRTSYEHAVISSYRNESFPKYLSLVREIVVDNVGPGRLSQWQSVGGRRRTHADGELDVFAAEQYFSGGLDGECQKEVALVVPVDAAAAAAAARPAVAKSRSARTQRSAVSASSEGSANSQAVLLRGAHQRQGDHAKKCYLLRLLMRSCSGKCSVDVDGGGGKKVASSGEPAAGRIDWFRDMRMEKLGLGLGDGMVASLPPNLNLGAAKVAVGRDANGQLKGELMSSSFRRGLTLLNPVMFNAPGGGKDDGDDDDDDVGSESSSDLFEIKSLMIEECPYEPSEASIQWSVVTASAAEASVASESSDRALRVGTGAMAAPVKQRKDWPPGLLSGCVSHKSVDVSAMTAVRNVPDKAARPEPPLVAPAMRRHIERFQKKQNGIS